MHVHWIRVVTLAICFYSLFFSILSLILSRRLFLPFSISSCIKLLDIHQRINYVCSKTLLKCFAVVVVLLADIMFCNTHREVSQFMSCDRGKKMQLHSSRQFAILIRLDVSLAFPFSSSLMCFHAYFAHVPRKTFIFWSSHALPKHIHLSVCLFFPMF